MTWKNSYVSHVWTLSGQPLPHWVMYTPCPGNPTPLGIKQLNTTWHLVSCSQTAFARREGCGIMPMHGLCRTPLNWETDNCIPYPRDRATAYNYRCCINIATVLWPSAHNVRKGLSCQSLGTPPGKNLVDTSFADLLRSSHYFRRPWWRMASTMCLHNTGSCDGQLSISQFRGVLHKPHIGIMPDPKRSGYAILHGTCLLLELGSHLY